MGAETLGRLREAAGSLYREIRVALTPVPRPDKWAFIAGCYNSGTTLLREVMAVHPDISTLPVEGHYLTDQLKAAWEFGLNRMWVAREDEYRLTEGDTGPDVKRLKKEWGMRHDTTKPVLLEKSPPNAARTRWLQEHFENAHFIGIIRNGYAVAEGIRRKGEPGALEQWPIDDCAYQWSRSNLVLEEDSKHLRHFMWVRYEDLAADTAGTLQEIFTFLGLSTGAGLNLDREWAIHERREPIKNMNAQSIDRLTPDDVATIERVAGDTLAHFGYSTQPD